MLPTVRQLQYAVAIARTRSFSRAARECGVTQPGLSTQIRRLERVLGLQLFERNSQSVLVTPVGERVVECARRVLADVDELVETAHGLTDPLGGTIRLGVIPTIAPYLLPRVMPMVRKRFPALRLLLREETTARVVELLGHGELDLALVALESELGELETCALFDDPFVVVMSPDHPLARRQRIRPSDLHGEEVLLLEDGHCLRHQTAVICEAAGACELGDFRATSLSTLIHMVENGVGLTLLPAMATWGSHLDARRLTVRPFVRPRPSRTVALAWRRSSPHRGSFEMLGEVVGRIGRSE